jgi:hypothetical protein
MPEKLDSAASLIVKYLLWLVLSFRNRSWKLRGNVRAAGANAGVNRMVRLRDATNNSHGRIAAGAKVVTHGKPTIAIATSPAFSQIAKLFVLTAITGHELSVCIGASGVLWRGYIYLPSKSHHGDFFPLRRLSVRVRTRKLSAVLLPPLENAISWSNSSVLRSYLRPVFRS